MSFSRAEILESIADDISTGFRSHIQFVNPETAKFDGYSVIRRKGRGGIDHTPESRTLGRDTNERRKWLKPELSFYFGFGI